VEGNLELFNDSREPQAERMPLVYGTFSNWQPKKMMKFKDLYDKVCVGLPREKDIFEIMLESKQIRDNQTHPNDLSER